MPANLSFASWGMRGKHDNLLLEGREERVHAKIWTSQCANQLN